MTKPTNVPESSPILAWHFLRDDQKLRDGRDAPPDGHVLVHEGRIVPCASGLHASEDILYALDYAPGHILCRVECWGTTVKETDKLACGRRRILWRINAEPLLRQWARWCALRVVHLWDPPEVVMDFLKTGDESLRAAAWAAARNAAAMASAGDTEVWNSAWAAARNAAALNEAAMATARASAWAAARNAAALNQAAMATATRAQRTKLLELIESARKEVYANRT